MPSYALMNSGLPIRNGIAVITPTAGYTAINGSGTPNIVLDDNYSQHLPDIGLDLTYITLAKRYINGGSSNWEKTLG